MTRSPIALGSSVVEDDDPTAEAAEPITGEIKAEIQLRFDELRGEIDDVKRRVDALG